MSNWEILLVLKKIGNVEMLNVCVLNEFNKNENLNKFKMCYMPHINPSDLFFGWKFVNVFIIQTI